MELRQIVGIVWKWVWLIALAVVIAAGSSYLASKAATPLYRTSTTLMIGRIIQDPDPSSMQIYTASQLGYTYIQLAKREPVLKGAIDSLGLQMNWQSLAGRVTASTIPQTQLLQISVVDSDPYRAKVLADAIAVQMTKLTEPLEQRLDAKQVQFTQAQLDDLTKKIEDAQTEIDSLRQELDVANSARQIQDLQTKISVMEGKVSGWQNTYAQLLLSAQGGDVNSLSILEEAAIPGAPFSPNVNTNVMTAAAIGLALAVAGIFLIEYLDDTVKNPDDVSRAANLPTLGAVPRIEGPDISDRLIAIKSPLSPTVEAFRITATNLQFSSVDHPVHTLMVTSPGPSEGKSTALANLASVMAQSGLKVIVVDTDLRRPSVHKIFNLPNRRGLTDALLQVISPLMETVEIIRPAPGNGESDGGRGEVKFVGLPECVEMGGYLQDTPLENLKVLSTGALPPNPVELLGSDSMLLLIKVLKDQADIVLFDCPPNLVVADAAVLSTKLDAVILVNDVGSTRTNELRRSVDELRRVHARILGVLLNRVGTRGGGYNYYYYYYYYYYEDGERRRKRRQQQSWLRRTFPWLGGGKGSSDIAAATPPAED